MDGRVAIRIAVCLVVIGICSVLLAGCIGVKQTKVVPVPPAPAGGESRAEASWKDFVADARAEAQMHEGVSIDYESLHKQDGHNYGVMVVAWENSEYEVDLYRFDPEVGDWELSPGLEEGIYVTDVPAASKEWGVPADIIETWLSEAHSAVKSKYADNEQKD